MSKSDCLPCRIGKSHTFHDGGEPNLSYAYEGTEPPIQDSYRGCNVDGCEGNHDFEHDESVSERYWREWGGIDEKGCPVRDCALDNGHDGPHENYRENEVIRLRPDEKPPTLKMWYTEHDELWRKIPTIKSHLCPHEGVPCRHCGDGDPDQEPLDLMRQAEDLVYGDRQGAYGHPYDDYSRTAGMWSSFLGIEITPAQAALMMVLLKISRERNRPKDDNVVDAHGYLLCYGRIQGRER